MSNFNINGTNTNLTQIFYSLSSPDATAQTIPTGFKYNDGGTEKDLITLFAKYVQGDLAPTTNYISTAYGNADLNTIFQNKDVDPVLYTVSNESNLDYNVNTNNGYTGLIFYINTGSSSGSATFTLNRNYNITIIVVAGGGGGGGGNGGGGGGGGTIYLSDSFTAGSYQILVGGGGTAGGTAINGGGGSTSSFKGTKYLVSGGGGGLTRGNNGNGGNGGDTTTVDPPPPGDHYSFGGGGGGSGGIYNFSFFPVFPAGGSGGSFGGDSGEGIRGSILGGPTFAGNGGNSYNYNYPAPPGGITLPFLNTQPKIQVGGGGAGGGSVNYGSGNIYGGYAGLGQGGQFPFDINQGDGQSSISSITNGYGNGGGGGVGNGGKGGDGVVIIYWQN